MDETSSTGQHECQGRSKGGRRNKPVFPPQCNQAWGSVVAGRITGAVGYPRQRNRWCLVKWSWRCLSPECVQVPIHRGNVSQRQQPKLCSPSFADVILPIVITLIVITLSVFSLVALYKMCQKKTPGIWFAFSAGGGKSMSFLLLKDLFWISLTITVVVVWWESFLYFVFCLKWETNTSFSKSVGRPEWAKIIFGE